MRIGITLFTYIMLALSVTLIGTESKVYALDIPEGTVELVKSEFTTKVNETTELIKDNKGLFEKIWEAIKEFFITIFNNIVNGFKTNDINDVQNIKDKVTTGVETYVTEKATEQIENIMDTDKLEDIGKDIMSSDIINNQDASVVTEEDINKMVNESLDEVSTEDIDTNNLMDSLTSIVQSLFE